MIFARSPPTSARSACGSSAPSRPAAGCPLNSPTVGARQQRRLDFAAFLDQRRDPPFAVAREVESRPSRRRWRRRGLRWSSSARKAGLVARRFDRGRERADRGLVERLRLGFRRRALCCPASTWRRASASAPWRSRARLRRRRPGRALALRRRRTGSGSRPVEDHAPPARRSVRSGRRRRLSTSPQGPALGRSGSRSSAAPAGSRRWRSTPDAGVGRVRAAAAAGDDERRPRAGRRERGRGGRRASAAMLFETGRPGAPRRASRAADRVRARRRTRRRGRWRSERHW